MIAHAFARAEPAPSRANPREQVRRRLHQLDACLEQLEEAHERGALTVPVPLALVIGRYVPAVVPGMTITQALELVMREQEPQLACGRIAPSAAPSVERAGSTAPVEGLLTEIDETDARDLTERIRAAACTANRVCSLLVEAHERRAWSALGYLTWSDYIRAEFRLSRSRSYELLDHGRVLRELEAATGLSGIPDISAYAAAQIKPYLAEVTAAIRARAAGLSPEGIARVAEQVVQEARSGHVAVRGHRRTPGLSAQDAGVEAPRDIDISRLYDAVDTLAHMPAAASTLTVIPPGDAHRLEGLHDACHWLLDFARAWHPGGPV
jgi:hypothetical protein